MPYFKNQVYEFLQAIAFVEVLLEGLCNVTFSTTYYRNKHRFHFDIGYNCRIIGNVKLRLRLATAHATPMGAT